jgi:TonB family protein
MTLVAALAVGAAATAQTHYVWPYTDPEHDGAVHVLHSGAVVLGEAAARKILTYSESPLYPANEYGAGTAAVRVAVTIDENGSVKSASAIGGPSLFRNAAQQAVRLWRFAPFQWNGRATPFHTQITIRFQRSTSLAQ